MLNDSLVDKTGLFTGGFYIGSLAVLSCPDMNEKEKIAFTGLLSFMYNQKTVAWPGRTRLLKRTGLKARSLDRAMQGLRLKGLIVAQRRGRKSNRYELRSPKWFKQWVKEFSKRIDENDI